MIPTTRRRWLNSESGLVTSSAGTHGEALRRLSDHHRRPESEVVLVPRVLVDHHLIGAFGIRPAAVGEDAGQHAFTLVGETGNSGDVSSPRPFGSVTAVPIPTRNGLASRTSGNPATAERAASSKLRVVGEDGRGGHVGRVHEPGHRVRGATSPGDTGREHAERDAREHTQEHPRPPPAPEVGCRPHPHGDHGARLPHALSKARGPAPMKGAATTRPVALACRGRRGDRSGATRLDRRSRVRPPRCRARQRDGRATPVRPA